MFKHFQRMHYFSLSFVGSTAHGSICSSVQLTSARKFISKEDIRESAKITKAGENAVLLSCSYLGKMTEAEFKGDSE